MNEDTIKPMIMVLTLIFWCRRSSDVVLVVDSNYTSVSLYEIKVVIKHVILDESLRLYGQAFKRAWWMPWQPEAMKDVVGHERPRGAVKQALIRGCPNGETHLIYQVSLTEYIGKGSERGELKHLSTRRKRNQLRFP